MMSLNDVGWNCGACTFANSGWSTQCVVCASPQPGGAVNEWSCSVCTFVNSVGSSECAMCAHSYANSLHSNNNSLGQNEDKRDISSSPLAPPPLAKEWKELKSFSKEFVQDLRTHLFEYNVNVGSLISLCIRNHDHICCLKPVIMHEYIGLDLIQTKMNELLGVFQASGAEPLLVVILEYLLDPCTLSLHSLTLVQRIISNITCSTAKFASKIAQLNDPFARFACEMLSLPSNVSPYKISLKIIELHNIESSYLMLLSYALSANDGESKYSHRHQLGSKEWALFWSKDNLCSLVPIIYRCITSSVALKTDSLSRIVAHLNTSCSRGH